MTLQQRLNAAESLITALQSGIKIVDQTFYQDPTPPGMNRELTESVVHTMLIGIDLYRDAVAA